MESTGNGRTRLTTHGREHNRDAAEKPPDARAVWTGCTEAGELFDLARHQGVMERLNSQEIPAKDYCLDRGIHHMEHPRWQDSTFMSETIRGENRGTHRTFPGVSMIVPMSNMS